MYEYCTVSLLLSTMLGEVSVSVLIQYVWILHHTTSLILYLVLDVKGNPGCFFFTNRTKQPGAVIYSAFVFLVSFGAVGCLNHTDAPLHKHVRGNPPGMLFKYILHL